MAAFGPEGGTFTAVLSWSVALPCRWASKACPPVSTLMPFQILSDGFTQSFGSADAAGRPAMQPPKWASNQSRGRQPLPFLGSEYGSPQPLQRSQTFEVRLFPSKSHNTVFSRHSFWSKACCRQCPCAVGQKGSTDKVGREIRTGIKETFPIIENS